MRIQPVLFSEHNLMLKRLNYAKVWHYAYRMNLLAAVKVKSTSTVVVSNALFRTYRALQLPVLCQAAKGAEVLAQHSSHNGAKRETHVDAFRYAAAYKRR